MQIIKLIFKWLIITALYLVTLMVGTAMFEASVPPPPQEQMGAVMIGLLLTAAVDAAVIMLLHRNHSSLRDLFSFGRQAKPIGFAGGASAATG